MSTDPSSTDPLIAREVIRRVADAIVSSPFDEIREAIFNLDVRTPGTAIARSSDAKARADRSLTNMRTLAAQVRGPLQEIALTVEVDSLDREISPEIAKQLAFKNFGMSLVRHHYSSRARGPLNRTVDGASFREFLSDMTHALRAYDLEVQDQIRKGFYEGFTEIRGLVRASAFVVRGADSPEVLADASISTDWLGLNERSQVAGFMFELYRASADYLEASTDALRLTGASNLLFDIWTDVLASPGLGDGDETLGAQLFVDNDGMIGAQSPGEMPVEVIADACWNATHGRTYSFGRGVGSNQGIGA